MSISLDTEKTGGSAAPGRSRRRSNHKKKARRQWHKNVGIACGILLVVMVTAAGVYGWMGQKYQEVFYPNTMINGLDASGKTVEEVEQYINDGMAGYLLTLELRDGKTEQIDGREIDLHAEYDGTMGNILLTQNPWLWGRYYVTGTGYSIDTMMVYDREKLSRVIHNLACMDPDRSEKPKDAYLSDYKAGTGYQIIPEEQGNRLVEAVVLEGVSEAILNLRTQLSMEELGAYEKPVITAEDETLKARVQAWNKYAQVVVRYQFGDKTETLDGKTIHTWLKDDGQGNPVLDEKGVADFVKALGKEYNTAYTKKSLKTSAGPTVTIIGGNYGWRINQNAETAALAEIIRSGEGQNREPIYSQTAASHTVPDYGDTYVEINLTAQHLYFYKNGSLVVEADFVSGNASKGWSTPAGAYPLTYKQRDATLKGEGYTTPVSYWMPFNGGIGLHDASWRSSFGGTIYKTSGSHGCVNLPPAAAKTIYENISTGIPVLCYHLEGTQKEATAAVPAETTAAAATQPAQTQPAQTQPAQTQPAQTQPTETLPAETSADQTQPAETTPAETTAAPVTEQATEATETATAASQNPADGPGGASTKSSGVVSAPGM